MARPLRIEKEDTFYHVLSRGNERRPIFRDDRDHRHFLRLLGTCIERFEIEIWSYVLMVNHYHLLVKTLQANLSRAIQWLGVSYSNWHNARHDRSGHLFQGRFKSFIIEEEAYIYRLILYMHRNPLRAEMVERLADYEWSSYRCLGYGRPCPEWFVRDKALTYFDGNGEEFLKAVADYDEEEDKLMTELRYGVILGSNSIVETLKKEIEPYLHREKPQGKRIKRHGSIVDYLRSYSEALGITREKLEGFRKPVRHRRRPVRDVLIYLYLLWKQGDFKLNEIGRHFDIGDTAAGNARGRAEKYLQNNPEMRDSVERLISG